MKAQRKILIMDRSVLAGNLYKLLFSELDATLLVRRKFEELNHVLAHRERMNLCIFNSNSFGKKFDEIFEAIDSDASLSKVAKIFILKEGDSENEWRERLGKLQGARIMTRPFHPDEFSAEVGRILGEEG